MMQETGDGAPTRGLADMTREAGEGSPPRALVDLAKGAGEGIGGLPRLLCAAGPLRAWAATIPGPEAAGASDPLAAVRAAYAASLPEKARDLAALVAAASAARGDQGAIAAARRLAHRLRGSAGSYGYWGLGELAAQIDDALAGEGGAASWSVIEGALLLLAPWVGER